MNEIIEKAKQQLEENGIKCSGIDFDLEYSITTSTRLSWWIKEDKPTETYASCRSAVYFIQQTAIYFI
ncbi:MAG: hypothetical protein GX270_14220 [Clostridiaceae bacterium]|jgi:hypothetical protein|nr:hypothetical protein [Clostridiaceae bacterium]